MNLNFKDLKASEPVLIEWLEIIMNLNFKNLKASEPVNRMTRNYYDLKFQRLKSFRTC